MAAIVRGNAHAAYTQSSTGQDIPSHQVVVLGDGEGNLLHTTASGSGDGTVLLGGAVTLLAMPNAAYTAADSPKVFTTDAVTYGALDITVASFQGGTTPSITFFLERQGADGAWYQILTTSAVSSALVISVDISPGLNGTYSAPPGSAVQHAVFTHSARLRWTIAGAPTSVTFSASFIGRS